MVELLNFLPESWAGTYQTIERGNNV